MNTRHVVWSDGSEDRCRDLHDLEGATDIVEPARKRGQRWFDAPSFEGPADAIEYARKVGPDMTTDVSTVATVGAFRIEGLYEQWRGLVRIRAADPVRDGFPAP